MEHARVLFVCFGNICRSPTAEGVLRHMFATTVPPLDVEIDSAGTVSHPIGSPPDPRSQLAAMRRGIDLSGLRARQVTAADLDRFDLILAMDRNNLRAVKSLRPRTSSARLELFLHYAQGLTDLEVPDPYFGDADGFERVLDLLTLASRGLIAALHNRPLPKSP